MVRAIAAHKQQDSFLFIQRSQQFDDDKQFLSSKDSSASKASSVLSTSSSDNSSSLIYNVASTSGVRAADNDNDDTTVLPRPAEQTTSPNEPILKQYSPIDCRDQLTSAECPGENSPPLNASLLTHQSDDKFEDDATNDDEFHHTSYNMQASPKNAPFSTSSPLTKKQAPQESYYHNLFQWEQLISKGVTRPLLINDLDFTDLRDEDDCDLLNSSGTNQNSNASPHRIVRNQVTGEPLTISIPPVQHGQSGDDHDSVDSGTSTGSPSSHSVKTLDMPTSAPPPLPPPPISPWFNTTSRTRPQSQFMSTPSPPPFDFNVQNNSHLSDQFERDQSPAVSTYSTYSRNSVCLTQHGNSPLNHNFNNMQPAGNLRSASSMSSLLFGNGKFANKRKKTMKLFWKEVREDRSLLSKLTKKKTIWDEIKPIQVDTQRLEYLFESKAKDLMLSKSRNGLDGLNQRKVKITVLDAKRSNAINIGMTKLPPMRTIKSAILKMDSTIMNREGIEKILTTMMPSEEEKSRIIEAQLANPDTPLGTAEQFLLNLASISALEARLKLWAFQLDYAQIEKEVAEPLMDLKQSIEEIERSETFRVILGTLLAIGNFLNSSNAKGFQIDYLEKVPEIKDTVNKHSLLHHLCLFVQEKYDPDLTSDLYSEFSAVNRASKVDYTEVAKNLKKMQQDCKASWDYLKIVAKHDGLASLMNTCGGLSSSSQSNDVASAQYRLKSSGKLNNLSKLSMITTVIGSENTNPSLSDQQQVPTAKQLKTKVSDFLTDCAERIMVLMVIHRRVMNRFQKLLVYLGCPSHQIKQTQPQQILKIINEFALEYRTKRERVREMLLKKQQCPHHHANRWQMNRMRWAGSQQCIESLSYNNRPSSIVSSYTSNGTVCADCTREMRHRSVEPQHSLSHIQQVDQKNHGPGSPSGLSQVSNFSDYSLDQSYVDRQESLTPVPSDNKMASRNGKTQSMSASMFNLQAQHNGANGEHAIYKHGDTKEDMARKRDEQMRRLLGAGKSLEGACNELYQMSHWSSTMTRVTRLPPKRTASIDSSANESGHKDIDDSHNRAANDSSIRQQSSYYRNLNTGDQSDEELLQSLVKVAPAKHNQHRNPNRSLKSNASSPASTPGQTGGDRLTKSKILSRFNCDRKSCE